VPPGARLILKDIPAQMQKGLGLRPEEGGKFIETSAEPYRHRDAIQLANGCVIPLQNLREGQRVEILSLVPAGDDRNRAINQYTQAQRTKDDTRGALEEAATYLQFPYPRK
jgi:hypothetical protein